MAIITIGIDLARNVPAVRGVDESGKPALVRPKVKRDALLELIAKTGLGFAGAGMLGL